MDKKRDNRHGRLKRKYIWWLGASAVVIVLSSLAYSLDLTTARIDREKILLGSVQNGAFEIKINANGVLLSRNVEWLSSEVEGRVAMILARPGDTVEKGQSIVKLTNPSLDNMAEEADIALIGAKSETAALAAELEALVLDQESKVAQARWEYQSVHLQYESEQKLMSLDNPPIPDIQFQQTSLRTEQLRQLVAMEKRKLAEVRVNVKSRLRAEESKVSQLAQVAARARHSSEALNIKAGISGVLQNMALKEGQRISPGEEVARIAKQDELYAELKVPARQASNVSVGQAAIIDTLEGVIDGTVTRIDPNVTAGVVVVDIELHGKLPRAARPEFSISGVIFVAKIVDTLYVRKPAFSEDSAGISVYVVDGDGSYARKKYVEFGKASSNDIQVLDGLKLGDKIIVSDTSAWKSEQIIRLR